MPEYTSVNEGERLSIADGGGLSDNSGYGYGIGGGGGMSESDGYGYGRDFTCGDGISMCYTDKDYFLSKEYEENIRRNHGNKQ